MRKEVLYVLLVLGIILIAFIFILKPHLIGLVSYTDIENVSTFNTYAELITNFSNVSSMEEFIFNWDVTNYTIYNNSLVLMMNFNNLSSLGENDTHIFDASISGNNATVSGATFTASGKYNGGFNFDGVDDYIDAGNDSSLNITENITVSVWINSLSSTTTLGNVGSYVKINTTNLGGELDSSDKFGTSLTNLGDLDGDGIVDIASGAQQDGDGGSNTGAVWVMFMYSNGSVKSHTKINTTDLGGEVGAGDYFGMSVANIGDLDGDGIVDIASGVPYDDDGGSNTGAVWVMFMYSNGSVKSYVKINNTDLDDKLIAEDKFGISLANIGDLDGDGIIDLAVGAGNGDITGNVWILFMYSNGSVKSHTKINDTNLGGELDADDSFGASLTNLGDLDGDGIVDIASGANLDDDGKTDAGAVYILFMYSNGSVKSHTKINDTNLGGDLDESDKFGKSIVNIGDLDGDGVIDIAASVWQDDDGDNNKGSIQILFMYSNGSVKSYVKINDTNLGGSLGAGNKFGRSIANIGDLNGDGVTDLISGSQLDDDGGNNVGAIWVMFIEDGFGSIINKQNSYGIRANHTHAKAIINGSFLVSSIGSGWNHIALTSNTTHKSLYVNGALSSITTSGTIASNIYDVYIGKYFNGTIDEPRIWNKSLSASEISQLYKSNLHKINSTAWNFYTNQTELSVVDYNYYFFVRDSFGLIKSAIGSVEINTNSNFKLFLLLADTHYGDTWAGDGSSNDINYTTSWIKSKNPDFLFHLGDITAIGYLSEFESANKDFNDLIQNTNLENIWFTYGGNHDGYNSGTSHWAGASFQRDRNLTSLWYTIREGNNIFIFTSIIQDRQEWESGWGGTGNSNHFIPMNKINWLEGELAKYENTENNIFVITHTPIVHTNAYTEEWAQMDRSTWTNTSERLLNLFEEYRVDVFIHGHVHLDPDKGNSTHENVSAGNVLLRGFRSDLPDTTFLHATDVNWEHGQASNINTSTYPSVMYFKMIEGNNYFDLRAVRTDTNDSVGISYNNSYDAETTLRIPLSYDITGMDTSNQVDFFEQGWGVWEFSDEGVGDYQWYRDDEGFRVNKSSWIISRWDLWEAEEITGFIVNYTETNGTLSHQFYCSGDSMVTWGGPYDDASDLGSCRWIQVNTTFSPTLDSVIYVYDMSFNMTPVIVTTDPSSGLFAVYTPTQNQLQEGYLKLLTKTQKVQMEINEQTYTAMIKSVDTEDKTVEIRLDEINETFVMSLNETKKIDLDDDGYYDLQISVKEIRSNGYTNLEFKEIHEEVPAEEQEEQEEESKVKIEWWYWVVGGIGILILGGIIVYLVNQKKRNKNITNFKNNL